MLAAVASKIAIVTTTMVRVFRFMCSSLRCRGAFEPHRRRCRQHDVRVARAAYECCGRTEEYELMWVLHDDFDDVDRRAPGRNLDRAVGDGRRRRGGREPGSGEIGLDPILDVR